MTKPNEEQKKPNEQKAEEDSSTKANPTGAENAGAQEDKTPAISEAKKAAKELRDATAAQKLENDRTEKLAAEAEFGGQAKMTPTENKKNYSPEELASRKRIKQIGDASGSEWAKDYE